MGWYQNEYVDKQWLYVSFNTIWLETVIDRNSSEIEKILGRTENDEKYYGSRIEQGKEKH